METGQYWANSRLGSTRVLALVPVPLAIHLFHGDRRNDTNRHTFDVSTCVGYVWPIPIPHRRYYPGMGLGSGANAPSLKCSESSHQLVTEFSEYILG